MFAPRRLLLNLRRPPPLVYANFRTRHIFFSTKPGVENVATTKKDVVADPDSDEIPKEIFDAIPQEVHEEMKELGEAYGEEFQKLFASPGARTALDAFKEALKGTDFDSANLNADFSKHPSSIRTIMLLAMNPKIREAGRNVIVEMEKAGVDTNKMEAIMWALQNVKSEEEP